MKKLSKLVLSDARILAIPEMQHITGGTSLKDYCCTLYWNIDFNWRDWEAGALAGAQYGISICVAGGYTGSVVADVCACGNC